MTERTVNRTERLHNVIYAIATLLVIGLIAVLMSGCADAVSPTATALARCCNCCYHSSPHLENSQARIPVRIP